MAYHQMQNISDDTFFFSVTGDIEISTNELNNELYQINKWAFQWKKILNSNPTAKTQEIIFCRKS